MVQIEAKYQAALLVIVPDGVGASKGGQGIAVGDPHQCAVNLQPVRAKHAERAREVLGRSEERRVGKECRL